MSKEADAERVLLEALKDAKHHLLFEDMTPRVECLKRIDSALRAPQREASPAEGGVQPPSGETFHIDPEQLAKLTKEDVERADAAIQERLKQFQDGPRLPAQPCVDVEALVEDLLKGRNIPDYLHSQGKSLDDFKKFWSDTIRSHFTDAATVERKAYENAADLMAEAGALFSIYAGEMTTDEARKECEARKEFCNNVEHKIRALAPKERK